MPKMKVSNISTYLVGPTASADGWSEGKAVLFVKLETEERVVGWGEAYAVKGRERAIEEIILSLGRELIAQPVSSPRAFRRNVAFRMAAFHRLGTTACAISNYPWMVFRLLAEPATRRATDC